MEDFILVINILLLSYLALIILENISLNSLKTRLKLIRVKCNIVILKIKKCILINPIFLILLLPIFASLIIMERIFKKKN